MSQQVLNHEDVHLFIIEMRSKRVSEGMTSNVEVEIDI